MKRYALLLVLSLGACSTINAATQPVDMTALSKSAYAAKSTYEAALIVAVAYNNRPRCTTPKTVITCSDPTIVLQLRKASEAADATTQAAENAVRTLGTDTTVVQAAVTAASQAVTALQIITTTYVR